jgi:linoleoyl-CoA desaturase
MSRKIKFGESDQSQFLQTVRDKTNSYFEKNNISKKANWKMVLKSIILIGLLIILYGLLVFGHFHIFIHFLLAAGLGITMTLIGFNICHDALHGSFSNKKWVNSSLGWLFNLIGANEYVWKITHNQIHHTLTNIVEHDADLEVAPGIIRINATEEWKPIHQYQQFYSFMLYSLSSLSWFFKKDYMKFFDETLREKGKKPPKSEYFKLFGYKALYYTIFLVIPLIVMPFAWHTVLAILLVMHLAEGMVMGNIFQLAHLVEETDMPEPHSNKSISDPWAVHQMKTTANFARKNSFITSLFGGLNYQIEHHLFPNICHVHYPAISEIVKDTAQEFGLPYHENTTFFGAVRSHYNFLKKMGKKPKLKVVLAS